MRIRCCKRDWKGARRDCEEVLRLDPGNEVAKHGMGVLDAVVDKVPMLSKELLDL